MRRRRLAVPLLVLLAFLGAAVPAAAAWVLGSGPADAAAASTAVNAPTAPVTTVTSSSVALSWTGPVGGAAPSGYTVQRTAPTSAPVCVAVTATTCTDTGLSPSTTYTYAVTTLSGLWVSTALVASAATAASLPSAFVVTVPATATAGTQLTVTIQAKDSSGSNDSSYAGTHALSFSGPGTVGGNAPSYPTSVTFNGSGFAANVKVTLYKAETVTLTAADPAASQRTGVSGAVTVAAGAASRLRWTTDSSGLIDACPTGSLVVGANGQRSWYVGELDQYGNRTVEVAGGRTIVLSRTPGGANAGTFTPTSLTIAGGANPAVTSATATLKLKRKTPVATTYTAASSPAAGITAASCTLSP